MSEQQTSLEQHNEARASAPGIKRPNLTWNPDLAKAAQDYAQHLADTQSFQHSGVSGQGENLYMSSANATFVDASLSWIGEQPDYHGQNIRTVLSPAMGITLRSARDVTCSALTFDIQIIWPSPTEVGIGKAVASNGATYVVGRYAPPGNMTGQSAYGSLPPTQAQNSGPQDYVVQAGDTLWKISQVFSITLDSLKAANPQVKGPEFVIKVGEVIHVPGRARGVQRMAKAPVGYVHPVPDTDGSHGGITAETLANGDHRAGEAGAKLTNGTGHSKAVTLTDGHASDKVQSSMHHNMKAIQPNTFAGDYTVIAGDSMWLIASKLGVAVEALEAANPQVSPPAYEIHVGQTLRRPGSDNNAIQYTVVAGDSMSLIAEKANISLQALEVANPQIQGPQFALHPGDVLTIPQGGRLPAAGGPSTGSGTGTTTWYSGPPSNFPSADKWMSWEQMSAHNAAVMNTTGNSVQETQWVLDAIQEWSGPSGIDRRGILAVVMQESHGQVRVNSTSSPGAGINNTGLMQAHNGASFNTSDPLGSIRQMIKDGACGVPGPTGGDGLQQLMERYHDFFVACRGYNSGDGGIHMDDLSNGGGATSSYCSDIANRLMGAGPN